MSYLESEEIAEKILFLGLSQSGKTSIIQVGFEGLLPGDTSTNQATGRFSKKKIDYTGKIISVLEVGGQVPFLEESFSRFKESVFSAVKLLVFVIDVSQPTNFERAQFYYEKAFKIAKEFNSDTKIVILAHKTDLVPQEEVPEIVERIINLFELHTKTDQHIFTTSIFDDSLNNVLVKIV